jgi:hypothetical protein
MNHAILSCYGKASERFCMKWTDMRPGREQTSGLLEHCTNGEGWRGPKVRRGRSFKGCRTESEGR